MTAEPAKPQRSLSKPNETSNPVDGSLELKPVPFITPIADLPRPSSWKDKPPIAALCWTRLCCSISPKFVSRAACPTMKGFIDPLPKVFPADRL